MEYQVGAAHRVIDSGRSVVEVAGEFGVNESPFGNWVGEERRRIEAASGAGVEPLNVVERVEFLRLRKQVSELGKDNLFLGKAAACFAANRPQQSGLR